MAKTETIDHGSKEGLRNGIERSPAWPKVEKAHLRKEPTCACCEPGSYPDCEVQVHHIFPFHYCVDLGRPDLELDDRNLITLCANERARPADNHHLLIGHLGDFKSSNLDVVRYAHRTFLGMSSAEIRNDRRWLAKKAHRLPPLDQMTEAERRALRRAMDRRFPRAKVPHLRQLPGGHGC